MGACCRQAKSILRDGDKDSHAYASDPSIGRDIGFKSSGDKKFITSKNRILGFGAFFFSDRIDISGQLGWEDDTAFRGG